MKKEITKLAEILLKLAVRNFEENNFEENRMLFAKLAGLKDLVANQNTELALEKELLEIRDELSETMLVQLKSVKFSELKLADLKKMHEDLNEYAPQGGPAWPYMSKVRKEIICRLENTIKEKKLGIYTSRKIKREICFYVQYVKNNSNGGHKEYQKAIMIFKKLGCPVDGDYTELVISD